MGHDVLVLTRRLVLLAAMGTTAIVSGAARVHAQVGEEAPRVAVGSRAPSFALPDGAGRRRRLWEFERQPAVVVVFLGLDPARAQDEWSLVGRLANQYRDRRVQWLTVDLTRSGQPPAALPAGVIRLVDRRRELAGWYEVKTTPWIVALDGTLIVRHLGGDAADDIARLTKTLNTILERAK